MEKNKRLGFAFVGRKLSPATLPRALMTLNGLDSTCDRKKPYIRSTLLQKQLQRSVASCTTLPTWNTLKHSLTNEYWILLVSLGGTTSGRSELYLLNNGQHVVTTWSFNALPTTHRHTSPHNTSWTLRILRLDGRTQLGIELCHIGVTLVSLDSLISSTSCDYAGSPLAWNALDPKGWNRSISKNSQRN